MAVPYQKLAELPDELFVQQCEQFALKNRGWNWTQKPVDSTPGQRKAIAHTKVVERLRGLLKNMPGSYPDDGPIVSNDILRLCRSQEAGPHDFMEIWRRRPQDAVLYCIMSGVNEYLTRNSGSNILRFFSGTGGVSGLGRAIKLLAVIESSEHDFSCKIQATKTAMDQSSENSSSLRNCIRNALASVGLGAEEILRHVSEGNSDVPSQLAFGGR